MNEDGEFFCEEHKPERQATQWWVQSEIPCKCEQCDKPAAWYVLEKK